MATNSTQTTLKRMCDDVGLPGSYN